MVLKKNWHLFYFISALLFVSLIYYALDKGLTLIPNDTLTTALFFVGMWLMVNKKIENWTLWIIGDVISVPLYFYKGMLFTSINIHIFTIAVFGYFSWRRIYKSRILK